MWLPDRCDWYCESKGIDRIGGGSPRSRSVSSVCCQGNMSQSVAMRDPTAGPLGNPIRGHRRAHRKHLRHHRFA